MPITLVSGQGSGDFLETYSRVRQFHIGSRWGAASFATPDAYTQTNPSVVTETITRSLTLAGITKRGVLGGMLAFSRPDIGNGFIGGTVLGGGSTYLAGLKPLGVLMNDANAPPYENAPGVASGKLAYHASGVFGILIWETQVLITQDGGVAGDPLTYSAGDYLYASVNGMMTNRVEDAYQYNVIGNDAGSVTNMGTVTQAPTGPGDLLVFDTPY